MKNLSDDKLIDLYNQLNNLQKDFNEVISNIEKIVKDKFLLYYEDMKKRVPYYKQIYFFEKLLYVLYFISPNGKPLLLLITDDGRFNGDLEDLYIGEDCIVFSREELEKVIDSNCGSLHKIKLWLQKSRHEELFLDSDFEQDFRINFKIYLFESN